MFSWHLRVSMTRPTGVAGEGRVEGLDEVGGGEVADTLSGFDGGDAERGCPRSGVAG